jgi:hypothetical protein
MNKALRERLDALDVKSVLLTILFLSLAFIAFFYYGDIRDLFRAREKQNYTGLTQGEVISIEPIQRVTQSKWKGVKIFVDSYKITYRYFVNGQSFQREDIVPVSDENEALLNSLLNVKDKATCSVKYDTEDPKKSILVKMR